MHKAFLTILLLGTMAAAQESGILVHLTPTEATFLVGTQPRTFSPKAHYAQLQKQGLGTIWKLQGSGKTLERVEAAGTDASVVSSLAAVHQFVDRVNESKFTEAHQLLSPAQRQREDAGAFKLNYQVRYFPHEGTTPVWKVQEVRPGRIITRVAFLTGTGGRASGGPCAPSSVSPGQYKVLELTAVQEAGNRWVLEGDHVYVGMNDPAWLPDRAAASRVETGKSTAILAHVQDNPPRACFVNGTHVEVVNLGSGQAATLRARGLGSRWSYFSRQGQVQTLAVEGRDAGASGALATLTRFITLVNGQKYPDAWKLLTRKKQQGEPLKIFEGNYQGRLLAQHPEDVKLIEVLPNKVVVRVRFIHNGSRNMYLEFPCVRESGQWRIDDSIVVLDEAGTKF